MMDRGKKFTSTPEFPKSPPLSHSALPEAYHPTPHLTPGQGAGTWVHSSSSGPKPSLLPPIPIPRFCPSIIPQSAIKIWRWFKVAKGKFVRFAPLIAVLGFMVLTACGGGGGNPAAMKGKESMGDARPSSDGTPQYPMYGYNERHNGRTPYQGPGSSPQVLWYRNMVGVMNGPSVGADGTIYVASGGFVVATNPDGTERWRIYIGVPDYHGGIAIGKDGALHIGGSGNALYKLNSDGSIRWTFPSGDDWAPWGLTLDGADTIFGGSGDALVAIGSAGNLLWRAHTGAWVDTTAAIDEGPVYYFGEESGYLRKVDASGVVIWRFPTNGVAFTPSLSDDGTVYVGSYFGSTAANLYAVNPDGTLKWSYSNGSYVAATAAVSTDGTVLFNDWGGGFYALKPNGTAKWVYNMGARSDQMPLIGRDGTVYTGAYNGRLYAFDVATGNVRWSMNLGGIINGIALGEAGVLYVTTAGPSRLYAIGGNRPPDTGKACATPDRLWPPNHKMRDITIGCVTDPDGDAVTITVTAITQDEPLNGLGDGDTSPDGIISPLQVRAERSGTGDGRVYRIDFIASDGIDSTPGSVTVCVPHSVKSACTDSRPPEYDSTQ